MTLPRYFMSGHLQPWFLVLDMTDVFTTLPSGFR